MTTQYLFQDITDDEGVRLKPYRDSKGIWSLGIGHNMMADPDMKNKVAYYTSHPLTMDQAQKLFEEDAAKAEKELDQNIPWWRSLNDSRQDTLLNMCFNLGCEGLMAWPHMLAFAKSGSYVDAAHLILSPHYVNEIHERAYRLAFQMETGERARDNPKYSQYLKTKGYTP